MANLSNINNKLIVTDGGQVLVNQTAAGFNPDADDLIVGNLLGNTGITIASGSNVGDYGSIYFADGTGSGTPSKAGYIRYEQNTSEMTIGINAVEKVAIDVSGNVLINSGVYLSWGTTGAASIEGSTVSNKLQFRTNSTDAMIIDSSQNVGIGTTSPDRSLDVEGNGMSIFGTGNYTELMLRGQVEGTGTVRNVGAWHWSIRSDVGGDNDDLKLLRFITGSYEGTAIQVRSDTGGVAIGLNNQGYSSQILSVKSGAADNVFYGESTDTNCFASFRDNSSTANIEYGAIGNAHVFRKDATEYMRITTGGQVGIGTPSPQDYDSDSDDLVVAQGFNGTNPAAGITIACLGNQATTGGKSAIRFADGTSGSERYIGGIEYQHAGDDMFFRTGGSIRMAIDSAGQVGIGTTDPSTKLHVSHTTVINDAYGLAFIENTSTSGGANENSAVNVKNHRGTSQFMQWEGYGLRIGSRILTNSGVGDVIFTAGADSEKMRIHADGAFQIGSGHFIDLATNGQHYHAAGPSGLSMREYEYYVDVPSGSTIDLFKNSSAHSDLQMVQISIVMYHSGRTYFTGNGVVGGYGMNITGIGSGVALGGLTSAVDGTGIRKLQITQSSGYTAQARIYIQFRTESGITVINGTLSSTV